MKCSTYFNVDAERTNVDCNQCRCGYHYDPRLKKYQCDKCPHTQGCVDPVENKIVPSCNQCSYGHTSTFNTYFCRPCCRTINVEKNRIECINCDDCPGDVAFRSLSRGYCRPKGCNCGSVQSDQHNVWICKPCNCECGTCTYEAAIGPECCLCHCKCGTYRYAPGFLSLAAANGFTSRRCKKCGGCFPSMARVSLENGKSVTMAELEVGDRIQAGGQSHYSSIIV